MVDADEDDDEDLGTLIVGLMQKGMRKKRKEGVDMMTVGYAVYRLKVRKISDLFKVFTSHIESSEIVCENAHVEDN